VFTVEIGDIGRFARPGQLCSWAGLTPKHHESDTTIIRGHVTKQGSRLVRWAAVEAVQVRPHDFKLRSDRDRIAARRGRNIGKVAAARRLLTLVYWGLRDGHSAACNVATPLPPLRPWHDTPSPAGNRRRALDAVHDPRSFGAVARGD
jgi:hypothetical protein